MNTSPRIRNCPFAFRCDKKWAQLEQTNDASIRFCNDCQKNVYFCETDAELAVAIKENRCVAVCISSKKSGFEVLDEDFLLGFPS